jgi:hypothetical protein
MGQNIAIPTSYQPKPSIITCCDTVWIVSDFQWAGGDSNACGGRADAARRGGPGGGGDVQKGGAGLPILRVVGFLYLNVEACCSYLVDIEAFNSVVDNQTLLQFNWLQF